MTNKSISVVVTDEMRAELNETAARMDRNISWVVRKAIEEYLERNKEEIPAD